MFRPAAQPRTLAPWRCRPSGRLPLHVRARFWRRRCVRADPVAAGLDDVEHHLHARADALDEVGLGHEVGARGDDRRCGRGRHRRCRAAGANRSAIARRAPASRRPGRSGRHHVNDTTTRPARFSRRSVSRSRQACAAHSNPALRPPEGAVRRLAHIDIEPVTTTDRQRRGNRHRWTRSSTSGSPSAASTAPRARSSAAGPAESTDVERPPDHGALRHPPVDAGHRAPVTRPTRIPGMHGVVSHVADRAHRDLPRRP